LTKYAFNSLSIGSTIPCAWVDFRVGRGPIGVHSWSHYVLARWSMDA